MTAGATEAITATLLALCEPGDEVVTLEPFYDSHAAAIALAGAVHRTVPLRRAAVSTSTDVREHSAGREHAEPPARFALDVEALRATVGPQTRIILVNTPHNPTGTVLTRPEVEEIAAVAQRHDVIVVTDEVYEHLTFDGTEHIPVATLPGMADRTVTISSAGKTFSLTGWKIGWLHARADLVTAIRTVKQYLTYVNGAPFQPAVALALTDPRGEEAVQALASSLARRRDLLCDGLVTAGFDVVVPQGTYFVVADGAPLGYDDGVDLARRLPEPRRGGRRSRQRVLPCRLGDGSAVQVEHPLHLRQDRGEHRACNPAARRAGWPVNQHGLDASRLVGDDARRP